MFGNATIRAVVQHKWQTYGLKEFIGMFVWHIADLSLLMAFMLLLNHGGKEHESVDQTDSNARSIVLLVLLALMMVPFARNARHEFVQVKHASSIVGHMLDAWSILDVLQLGLYVGVVVLYLSGSDGLRYVLGFAVYVKWFGMLYYLQAFEATGALIRMIFQIIVDIRWLLVVLGIVVLGVASCFYAILRRSDGAAGEYGNAIKSLFTVFNMLLFGSFNLEDVGSEETSGIVVKVIYAVSMILVSIVLLNLLIGKLDCILYYSLFMMSCFSHSSMFSILSLKH